MSTNQSLHAAAADALVRLLPAAVPLRAVADPGPAPAGQFASAVSAAFVGASSADVAVAMADTGALAAAAETDSPLVSVGDVLRPALEAATGVLGAGVLGEARQEDASALFAAPDAKVFRLVPAGAPETAGAAGWFAIRIRGAGTVNAAPGPMAGAFAGSAFGTDGAGVSGPAAGDGSVTGKLGRISNVEMALTVEIGRTRLSVRDVLDLEPGGVIELDRSAGAPADVLLNGRLIAHGEVVVVDQDYAVRITKILDAAEGLG